MAPAKRTTEVYDKILAGDLSFEVPLGPGHPRLRTQGRNR